MYGTVERNDTYMMTCVCGGKGVRCYGEKKRMKVYFGGSVNLYFGGSVK